ncbi:MAG: hypothetical protein JWM74_178 [Myxococcaceae bacterium]|nr:hypothetical protein [Myxococcaceae bacterium]
MKPPPEDQVPAVDLWMQLCSMERPHRLVPFPRKGPAGEDIEVAMFVLVQDEGVAAKASAERYARKILKEDAKAAARAESGQGYDDIMEMRSSVELLFRSCKHADDLKRPFFPTVEAISKALTTDEIAVLVLHYRRVQMELGPIVNELSEQEMDAWVEALAKGGAMFPFDTLSLGTWSLLFRRMASQLYSSRTASGSPGSPPGEPT